MSFPSVPIKSISGHVPLSWSEVLYGLEHGYLSLSAVGEVARNYARWRDGDWREVELITTMKQDTDRLIDIVKELVSEEQPQDPKEIQDKWTYLFIRYIFTSFQFDEFYRKLLEYYFSIGAPKDLEKLINFKPRSSAGTASGQRELTRQIIIDFLGAGAKKYA